MNLHPNHPGVEPVYSLPPVPLTIDQAAALAAHETVTEVYVAQSEAVYTLAGLHEGTILEMIIEFTDRYLPLWYTMAADEKGLAWHRGVPTKTEADAAEMIRDTIAEYEPISQAASHEAEAETETETTYPDSEQ